MPRASPPTVGVKAELDGALEAAAAQFGPIHGLFANAGLTGGFTPAVAFDSDVFEQTIAVNLTSVFWAIQKVLPAMIAAKNGVILVTGSMGSKRGMAMNPAYVAEQARRARADRAIAVEMAPHGVRANCVIPGFIVTEALERIPDEQKGKIAARCRSGAWARRWSWPKSPRSCSATRPATSPARTGPSTAGSGKHRGLTMA
jgi:NAD(P)-dependent dehydrogenase (short-subunit alcohol dehydrogenase family)